VPLLSIIRNLIPEFPILSFTVLGCNSYYNS
jgi:hypothetical protein